MKIALTIAHCVIAIGAASAAHAQVTDMPRVGVTVSGGLALVSRGPNEHPVGAVTASLRVSRDVSIDIEGAIAGRSGEVMSDTPGEGQELRRRVERSFTVFARKRVWQNDHFAVEPVLGIGRMTWSSEDFTRVTGQTGGPWAPSMLARAPDDPAWAITTGANLPFGSRRVAVVPEGRIRFPLKALRPSLRLGVGVRLGFF